MLARSWSHETETGNTPRVERLPRAIWAQAPPKLSRPRATLIEDLRMATWRRWVAEETEGVRGVK